MKKEIYSYFLNGSKELVNKLIDKWFEKVQKNQKNQENMKIISEHLTAQYQ